MRELLLVIALVFLSAGCATTRVHCLPSTGELDVVTSNVARVGTVTATSTEGYCYASVDLKEESGWAGAAIALIAGWLLPAP